MRKSKYSVIGTPHRWCRNTVSSSRRERFARGFRRCLCISPSGPGFILRERGVPVNNRVQRGSGHVDKLAPTRMIGMRAILAARQRNAGHVHGVLLAAYIVETITARIAASQWCGGTRSFGLFKERKHGTSSRASPTDDGLCSSQILKQPARPLGGSDQRARIIVRHTGST